MGNKVDQLEKRIDKLEYAVGSLAEMILKITDSKKGKTSETKTQTSSSRRKKV